MDAEKQLADFIARSREARAVQASRVSGLIQSIAAGIPYEPDTTDPGDTAGTVEDPQSDQVSRPEGET